MLDVHSSSHHHIHSPPPKTLTLVAHSCNASAVGADEAPLLFDLLDMIGRLEVIQIVMWREGGIVYATRRQKASFLNINSVSKARANLFVSLADARMAPKKVLVRAHLEPPAYQKWSTFNWLKKGPTNYNSASHADDVTSM
jgi:hypothetical protein